MSSGFALQGLSVQQNQITIQGLSAVKENDQWSIGQPSPYKIYNFGRISIGNANKALIALEQVVSNSDVTIFGISNRTAVKLFIAGFLKIEDFQRAQNAVAETQKPLAYHHNHTVIILEKVVAGRKVEMVIFNEMTIGQDTILPMKRLSGNNSHQYLIYPPA